MAAITDGPDQPFSDSTYLVGTDISPGTWRAENTDGCYWARLPNFKGGGANNITANDNDNNLVTISSNMSFTRARCSRWTKVE